MGLFEHFPYTDFHRLNLDWILKFTKSVRDRLDLIDAAVKDAQDARDAAESYATNAENSAAEAASSRDIAYQAASDAEDFKNDAEAAKEAAEDARDDAINAKNAAEDARDDAINAKDAAEDARDDAISAKDLAEDAADNAQQAASDAGDAKDAAEAAQEAAEQAAAGVTLAGACSVIRSRQATTFTSGAGAGSIKIDSDAWRVFDAAAWDANWQGYFAILTGPSAGSYKIGPANVIHMSSDNTYRIPLFRIFDNSGNPPADNTVISGIRIYIIPPAAMTSFDGTDDPTPV